MARHRGPFVSVSLSGSQFWFWFWFCLVISSEFCPAASARLVRGGHRRMRTREIAHHVLILLLVRMDGLRVVAKVVEPGELLAVVAREGALAAVFAVGRGVGW